MSEARTSPRKADRRLLAMAAGVVALLLVLRFWPTMTLLDRMELRTLDWRFVQRGARPPHPDLVILAVDEASIGEIGRWPWPRRQFAGIVRSLAQAGARAVVFDIFFAEPDRSPGGAESDAALAAATADAGMVYYPVFGYVPKQKEETTAPAELAEHAWSRAQVREGFGLNQVAALHQVEGVTLPLPALLEGAAGVGFVNVVDSGDAVFRHVFPIALYERVPCPSLALAVCADLLGVTDDQVIVEPGRGVVLGHQRVLPLDRAGRMLVDFAGGSGTYPQVSVKGFLELARDPAAVAERFRHKIVLVAVTAPGLYDLRACPFTAVYHGAETQANVIGNLLEERFLRQAPGELTALAIVLSGLLVYAGFRRLRPGAAVAYGAGLVIAHNWLCVRLFTGRGYVVDMVAPNAVLVMSMLGILALRVLGEERQTKHVRATLAKFVPPEIVDRALEQDPRSLLRGQRRVLTVLFADLRGYTTTSGRMAPEDAVELLNRFFLLVHEIIWEYGGTLDKYIGDGLMAFFNAPVLQEDHALRAVQMAVEMQKRIKANRGEWDFLGMPDLAAGVGMSTGEAVVGYIGTGERMQYTAIGPHVNLAARLEPLNRELGTDILISQSTYDLVSDAVEARAHGPVQIRGFTEPLPVYEVLGVTRPITP